MGDPGKRVPVGTVAGSKGPTDTFKGKAVLYMGIVDYIIGIIIALGTIAGSVIAVDSRYTHHDEYVAFVQDYQMDKLENNLDKIQQREWQLQDRKAELEKKKQEPGLLREVQKHLWQRERFTPISKKALLPRRSSTGRTSSTAVRLLQPKTKD